MKRNLLFKVLLMFIVGLFLSIDTFAQQMIVKGLVKDATGEPVIGANVVVKGTTNGTITDFDGNFQLTANKGDMIVISFIGYLTQELPAAASLNVMLKDDTETLEEVVVIGYGVAKKNDLTGSVTAMKPDAKNKGLVVNAQDMISGKIAGVNVTSNDGAPGSGAQIRIRGGSSLNASNDPLIVIDGMAMDNEGVKGLSNKLAMINPQDIESFNVLKDASATAIYGSRGSNGVIIITTKKGRKGQKPSVSYSGSVTLSQKKKTVDVLDGNQYRQLITNLYGEDSDAYRAMGTANTNWQDLIYRTALSHDHNVTVSGAV
ncbi:MAG: TonB-dependent receptor plug domain-containing protein, partial [Phocaeicola sp.]|nr:TonB-dependent receptor plug domain-containing protein [Phocaeicola sp.]